MPNWVENYLRITSEKPERIKAIREKLFAKTDIGCEYLSYAVLVPEDHDDPDYRVKPENAGIEPSDDVRADGTIFDWYQFHNDKWGCKWDVDPEECDINEYTDSIYVSFTSPWDCPYEWYKALCEAFPDVSIELVARYAAMDYRYWENGELGGISQQFDEKVAKRKRSEMERILDAHDLSLDDYDVDKIIEEYEDGYFTDYDMFDPDTWDFSVSDEDDFIEF